MKTAAPKHPAKFSDSILGLLNGVIEREVASRRLKGDWAMLDLLDPMAGVGRIHGLASSDVTTLGVELEPEWGDQHPHTRQGDATALAFAEESFDIVCTSPAYGNRMADHHNAKDTSKRMTYKHQLGRDLSPNNGGGLQWGGAYRELHQRILSEMVRVAKINGLVIVNVSNHIRKDVEEPVSEWWLGRIVMAGLSVEEILSVGTPRMGFGENAKIRTANEWVFVTRKVRIQRECYERF